MSPTLILIAVLYLGIALGRASVAAQVYLRGPAVRVGPLACLHEGER